MVMATKKFSFGSPEVSSTKKRGGGPSMGASTLAIGEGLNLRTPALKPQASAASTFYSPTAPNAPGATSVPQGSTVAKPSGDLENLANNLSSLNENLVRFSSTFIESQAKLNKAAEKRADEVAVKLSQTNGNLMGEYNKILNKADKDRTNSSLSAKQQALAEDNYNTLKSLDPRAADYLSRALEYQHGLKLVANAPNYIGNLKDESGAPRILRPYTEDGSSSELDIVLNEYYSNGGITNPGVLVDLRPAMVNQNANIKRTVAKAYAVQQDERHKDAFVWDVDNLIKNTTLIEDANYIKGSGFTEIYDKLYHSGMSTTSLTKVEEKLTTTITDLILSNSVNLETGTLDPALYNKVKDFILDDIEAAKTGPIDSQNRPSLLDKLGPTFRAQVEAEVDFKYTRALDNQKVADQLVAARQEEDLFYKELEKMSDGDPNEPGVQPVKVKVGDKDVIFRINPESLENYKNNRIIEIINNEPDYNLRRSKIKQVEDLVTQQIKGLSENRYAAGKELESYVGQFNVSPQLKLAAVEHAKRFNIITQEKYTDLRATVRQLIGLEDREVRAVIDGSYDDIVTNVLEPAAKLDLLGVTGGAADTVTGEEDLRIAQLLNETVLRSGEIWAGEGTKQQRLADVRKLWAETKDQFAEFNVQAFERPEQNPYLTLYEQITNKESDVQKSEDGETIELKDGETTVPTFTRQDGSTYIAPDTSYSDNEQFVLASDEVEVAINKWEELSDYYNNLVKEGKIKEGEPILRPDLAPSRQYAYKTGMAKALPGEYLTPTSLKKMYDDIDLLIEKANQANDPVYQTNLHWTDFSSDQISSRGKEYNYIRTFSAGFANDQGAQVDATINAENAAKIEVSQKFKGIYGMDQISDLAMGTGYLRNYLTKRKNELFVYEGSGYGGATPVDPAAPEAHETTPFNQRGTLFAETPWHIIDKIGEKRGKLGSSAVLSREIKEKPIYEKYVFLEQIEALAAQSSWIPYAHDLNIILKKTNTQPLNFFLHQYRAHTGEDMPMNLQQKIINRLSTKNIENMKNPLFRQGLLNKFNKEKDQAMILDRDEKLIANSWMPQEGTLVASTDLKGVLPKKKVEKKITLSTDENNIKRAETNFPIIYEAAKKVGIKFPEIPAAQMGEESTWGLDPSGKNNYWGIKATPQEVKDGKATLVTTSEIINGKEVIIKDYFKNFDTIEDALQQYKKEWNDDFQGRTGSSKGKTRKEAIQILKDGGYATNPNYVDTIETIANEYSDLY
tara:strand:+ start:764 stop:4495 length:3732 start_codon:yes stop_codon:yes gene_type:complete